MSAGHKPPPLHLLVAAQRWEADGVLSLELADPDGGELPGWRPGAHVELTLPSGLIRQYSLCGDPAETRAYRIAVLRNDGGRGGSKEIHTTAMLGRTLPVGPPRNFFELVDASRYVFIAGGIGITPILSMVREAARRGDAWELHYGGRTRASMAFLDALEQFHADAVTVIPQDEQGHPDLSAILPADLAEDTAVYCCGPVPMIAAVEARCAEIGREKALHVEHFGRTDGDVATAGGDGRTAFEVHLAASGLTLQVPPERTLLDVIREALPDVPYSCEEGICGTCETDVVEGEPEHHDLILTPDERAANATMMICVGRSCGPRLVLKL